MRWLFVTREDKVVIGQFPNAPLIAAFVADIVSYASRGDVHLVSNRIAQALFAIWAVMEIGWGMNPFRRILGFLVLGLMTFAFIRSLS